MNNYRHRTPCLCAQGDLIYFKNFGSNFPEILQSPVFPNALHKTLHGAQLGDAQESYIFGGTSQDNNCKEDAIDERPEDKQP